MSKHEMIIYGFNKYVKNRFPNHEPKLYLEEILKDPSHWKGNDILSFYYQELIGKAQFLKDRAVLETINHCLEEYLSNKKHNTKFISGITEVDYYYPTQEDKDTIEYDISEYFDIDGAELNDVVYFFMYSVLIYYIAFIDYTVRRNKEYGYFTKIRKVLLTALNDDIDLLLTVATSRGENGEENNLIHQNQVHLAALYRTLRLSQTVPAYKAALEAAYIYSIDHPTLSVEELNEQLVYIAKEHLVGNLVNVFAENLSVFSIELQVDLVSSFFNVTLF